MGTATGIYLEAMTLLNILWRVDRPSPQCRILSPKRQQFSGRESRFERNASETLQDYDSHLFHPSQPLLTWGGGLIYLIWTMFSFPGVVRERISFAPS